VPSEDVQEVAVKAKRRTATRLLPPTKNRPPPAKNRPPPAEIRNQLLASLPASEAARLLPTLDVVPLKLKQVVHKPGEPIRHVYFPGGGFCSILTVLEDGSMVEVATIGREGIVGVFAATDGRPPTSAAMVQGETDVCYRMTVEAFRREMDARGPFYELVNHFAQAFVGFVMQSTGCNAVHTVEQRLARWLLMAQDRMESDEFPLTQEFVAMMLGATRPTVTVVAGTLQKAGLITYHRGHVTVVDRERLEAASCECYRAATDLLTAVTGKPKSR
jgi:CRP-like cAMP-binding protein